MTHEILVGQRKTAHINGNLVVHDMKDSQGRDVRIPGRCFKILYHQARSNDWNVPPRSLIYLAMEARQAMPELVPPVLDQYLEMSLWPEERAWACCMRGEICERHEDYEEASEWYTRALAEHPSSKAAFRLCRSSFHECKWQECVDAFRIGVENKQVLQLLDNGPVYEDMSKILVAAALDKRGRLSEAVLMCREAASAFPGNSNLALMLSELERLAGSQSAGQG